MVAIEKSWRKKFTSLEYFDRWTAMQFITTIEAGLREHHKLLELGCDCLGLARLVIPYLNQDRYTGVDKDQAQINLGIAYELGNDMLSQKMPRFIYDMDNYHTSRAAMKEYDFITCFNLIGCCSIDIFKAHLSKMCHLMHSNSIIVGSHFAALDQNVLKAVMSKRDIGNPAPNIICYSQEQMSQIFRAHCLRYESGRTHYFRQYDDVADIKFFTASPS